MFSYLRYASTAATARLQIATFAWFDLRVPDLQQEDRYTQQCEAEVPCLEWGARLDRLWQRARHAQGISCSAFVYLFT